MKKTVFIYVGSVIEDMLRNDGLTPPSRQTLKNWRKGSVAKKTTKEGVKEYPIAPKLVKDTDYTEKPGGRSTVKYSQSGYEKIKTLTANTRKNRAQSGS